MYIYIYLSIYLYMYLFLFHEFRIEVKLCSQADMIHAGFLCFLPAVFSDILVAYICKKTCLKIRAPLKPQRAGQV